ncbi:MAG: hypothetical protein AB8D78_13830 [Akkermansiaceae bacterium]
MVSTNLFSLRLFVIAVVIGMVLPSCVTRRTVTQNGRTIEKKTVIKRPVKNLINSIEVE